MAFTRYTRPHNDKYSRKYGFVRDHRISINTSVCFDCRNHGSGVICQFCNEQMVNLGWCPKIPKKNDKRGWLKLAQVYWRYLAPRELLESQHQRWKALCQSPNSLMFNNVSIKPKAPKKRRYR